MKGEDSEASISNYALMTASDWKPESHEPLTQATSATSETVRAESSSAARTRTCQHAIFEASQNNDGSDMTQDYDVVGQTQDDDTVEFTQEVSTTEEISTVSPAQGADAVDSDVKPSTTPAMSAKAAGRQRQKFVWEETEAGPDAATGMDQDRTDASANQPSLHLSANQPSPLHPSANQPSPLHSSAKQPSLHPSANQHTLPLIIRSLPWPTPAPGCRFKHAVNPTTRTPQFGNYKGKELHKRIKKLPAWQQAQELEPWFAPLTIAVLYLHYEEGIEFKVKDNTAAKRALGQMRFSSDIAKRWENHYNLLKNAKEHLPKAVAFLNSHNPPPAGPPLNAGLAGRTFRIAGPVDCSYTNVLDVPSPEAMLQDKQGKDSATQTDNACISAVMELPKDTLCVMQIKTLTWHRLRLLQPDLLLWPINGKITDTNPDVLASSSWFINFCFHAY